jgi:Mobilization protein NikA
MGTSGSQKRKVTARIAINCTPAQKAAIMKKIDATGLSPSAMCLAILLDVPLPARRRPSVDTVLLAKVLAELGKIGSNINQIAYHLNAGRPGDVLEGSIEAALAELVEWRTALMQALGYERNRKPQE